MKKTCHQSKETEPVTEIIISRDVLNKKADINYFHQCSSGEKGRRSIGRDELSNSSVCVSECSSGLSSIELNIYHNQQLNPLTIHGAL